MGRRPTGRKYPKHISIQVKDQHNTDLKAMTEYLNTIAKLNGKKWTIRDVILTLLYGSINNDPNWFIKHHFEKLPETDLEKIRMKIYNSHSIQSDQVDRQQTAINGKIRHREPKLKFALKPEYNEYLNKLSSLSEEGN